MKYFSLFSGVGGFELAINNVYGDNRGLLQGTTTDNIREVQPINQSRQVGATCVGFSEIDKYAISVYQYHYKNHKNYGDITTIDWKSVPDFDLVVGGSPCQDLSVAGKQKGLSGERSGLFFEFVRCLKEKQPTNFIWENVKGALSSSSGWDFARVQIEFSEAGYDCEWQVLNAKDFGVPQNRERIFVVGTRKDIGQSHVFPVKSTYEKLKEVGDERVYFLSQGLPENIREFLCSRQGEKLPREQMQGLLTHIQENLQNGKCGEVQNEAEIVDSDTKGSLQVVEELNSWTQGNNNPGGVCGVVSIPTEDLLLLWNNPNGDAEDSGQIQQQSLSADSGQDRLVKKLCGGESIPLLLTVQSHQGRLFYSVGDGTDWINIYQTQVETICKTLSSILEENPDQKYFLSPQVQSKLVGSVTGIL
jgi:DNA-cytosine methyltransferase